MKTFRAAAKLSMMARRDQEEGTKEGGGGGYSRRRRKADEVLKSNPETCHLSVKALLGTVPLFQDVQTDGVISVI